MCKDEYKLIVNMYVSVGFLCLAVNGVLGHCVKLSIS